MTIRTELKTPEQEKIYEDGFLAGQEQLIKSSVHRAVNRMAQPEQEPVAWPCLIDSVDFSANTITLVMQCEDYKVSARKHWLSITPPQRTWVGLTPEETDDIIANAIDKVDALIQTADKLKDKNT